MALLHIKRAVYGSSKTPIKLREYYIVEIGQFPVGNIKEMTDFAKRQGYTGLNITDVDSKGTRVIKFMGKHIKGKFDMSAVPRNIIQRGL